MFHVDYLIKPCNYPITDDWKSELAHAHTADETEAASDTWQSDSRACTGADFR